MAARGWLAATLLALVLIGCSLAGGFKCYTGEMMDKEKMEANDPTCEGGVCKLVIQYNGIKLNSIKSITGSCEASGETGCWKYQGDHRAECLCKLDHCNSKENQDRAIKNAINHADGRSQGAWTLLAAILLFAIHHNSR